MVVESDADIFRHLYPQLRAMAAVVGDRQDSPDDLVQEALVRVLRNGALSDLTHPKAYLRATIVSVAHDRHRTQQRTLRTLFRVGERPLSTQPLYPSELSALDGLAPIDRSILYLNIVEKWTFEEIAELLEKRPGAIRKRASRAKKYLQAKAR